jgi:CubicO group peptidase (beta-lactamase class C family)
MTTMSSLRDAAPGPSVARTRASPCIARAALPAIVAALASLSVGAAAPASAQPSTPGAAMDARIQALIPELETYAAAGMKAFDVPGLALGIVSGDRLVYAKGFGIRSKAGTLAVDPRTVFQIGSTTKAFLAATMAIAVDRGKLKWDDRVVDLHPSFQLKDAWVTREFRVYDLIAQRSGLPPYANDTLALLGYDEPALIRSLRHVEPVSSFRSTFAYTNITHLLAARIVADVAGAPDWNAVARRELLEPLGMTETTFGAEAIQTAANHAEGHRWTPDGTIGVPLEPIFPYALGAAGNLNSTIEDAARWVRLQLGNGSFEGRRLVSTQNLAYVRRPKVAITDKVSYALGWVIAQTPNGSIVWHNGGTTGFGAFIGMLVDKDVGVIVLSNEQNKGLPDAIGLWALDRLVDNPVVDHVADKLKEAKSNFLSEQKPFAKPERPRPFPPLAPLAGSFTSPVFGKAAVRPEGGMLVLELEKTSAQVGLEPWDGEVFTIRLLPRGRFAPVVANMDERPFGFAQFESDKDGKLGLLRLTFDDGQAYELRRE